MKRIIRIAALALIASAFLTSCGSPQKEKPVSLILDTDIGNDIDDVLAMQMIINYDKAGLIDLKAVTISKCNRHSLEFADGYLRYNGLEDIPLGFAYDGDSPDDYYYLLPTLGATADGEKILKPQVDTNNVEPGHIVLRRQLADAKDDNSIVLLAIGPLTNIGRLLDSGPDEISELSGIELMAKKAKALYLMGGMYSTDRIPEWNIRGDIPAAQTVFSKCPVPLVASGYEVGCAIHYPHESIERDFGDTLRNPLTIAYCHYGKMPYDRETWDLTAAYQAAEPDNTLFRLSEPGHITIEDDGLSVFSPAPDGLQRYLIIAPERTKEAQDSLVARVKGTKK